MPEFTWNAAKAARNRRKHGVAFPDAKTAFDDPRFIGFPDDAHSYDEPRWNLIGRMRDGRIIFITYTIQRSPNDDAETFHLVTARPASRQEQDTYATA